MAVVVVVGAAFVTILKCRSIQCSAHDCVLCVDRFASSSISFVSVEQRRSVRNVCWMCRSKFVSDASTMNAVEMVAYIRRFHFLHSNNVSAKIVKKFQSSFGLLVATLKVAVE